MLFHLRDAFRAGVVPALRDGGRSLRLPRVGGSRLWAGPGAGPGAGIARLEMPSGIGRAAAVEPAERAAGWLPRFASALHRDARTPVNLPPIPDLERHLHRRQGDLRLARRAVREAVLERNRDGQGGQPPAHRGRQRRRPPRNRDP